VGVQEKITDAEFEVIRPADEVAPPPPSTWQWLRHPVRSWRDYHQHYRLELYWNWRAGLVAALASGAIALIGILNN